MRRVGLPCLNFVEVCTLIVLPIALGAPYDITEWVYKVHVSEKTVLSGGRLLFQWVTLNGLIPLWLPFHAVEAMMVAQELDEVRSAKRLKEEEAEEEKEEEEEEQGGEEVKPAPKQPPKKRAGSTPRRK